MKNKWLNGLARDLVALGGIPFLLLTIVRVSVSPLYYPMQFIISSSIFFILKALFGGKLHAGIASILTVFISLYYKSWLFAVFASLVYIAIIISLFYLGTPKKELVKGILFGAISTIGGYFIVRIIFLR